MRIEGAYGAWEGSRGETRDMMRPGDAASPRGRRGARALRAPRFRLR